MSSMESPWWARRRLVSRRDKPQSMRACRMRPPCARVTSVALPREPLPSTQKDNDTVAAFYDRAFCGALYSQMPRLEALMKSISSRTMG